MFIELFFAILCIPLLKAVLDDSPGFTVLCLFVFGIWALTMYAAAHPYGR